MQCDEIVVLENGRVVEQGAHETLVSKGGRYAQLWGQQNNTEGNETVNEAMTTDFRD
eukprot:Gb_41000 [translate_table: standard]